MRVNQLLFCLLVFNCLFSFSCKNHAAQEQKLSLLPSSDGGSWVDVGGLLDEERAQKRFPRNQSSVQSIATDNSHEISEAGSPVMRDSGDSHQQTVINMKQDDLTETQTQVIGNILPEGCLEALLVEPPASSAHSYRTREVPLILGNRSFLEGVRPLTVNPVENLFVIALDMMLAVDEFFRESTERVDSTHDD